ncbi:MAG: glycosyltransferase family 39 protein [bacterium]
MVKAEPFVDRSLWVKSVRPYVIAVLVVAAAMRVGFLCSGKVLPVMWDARRYVAAAIGIISYFDSSGPQPSDDDDDDRDAFLYYYERYVQGEKIDWMHYLPHRLQAAREEIFFGGPVYPSLVALVIAIVPAHDFSFVRILGLILDLLSNLLLMIVAVNLCNRRTALVAGLVYAIYFPFVLMSSMLLLESSTTFLMLSTMALMVRAIRRHASSRWLVMSGASAGLLALNKPTALLLFVPLFIGWYLLALKRGRRPRFAQVLLVMVPTLLIIGCWVAITSAKYGQLAVRDPAYAATNLRQSSSIDFEGYDLDEVEPNFEEREVYPDLAARFPEYAGLFAKKWVRLYSRPYNDFEISYILPPRGWGLLHEGLLYLGLVGLVLLLRERGRLAAWPILIPLYYTGLHLVFHAINRYSFNALPMLLIGAGFSVDYLLRSASATSKGRRSVVVGILLGLAGWAISYNLWVHLGPALSLTVVVALLIAKTLLLCASVLAVVAAQAAPSTRWRLLGWTALVSIPVCVMLWTPVLSRSGWAEFKIPIESAGDRTGIRMYISDLDEVDDDDLLVVMVDINTWAGSDIPFTVSVNDRVQTYRLSDPALARYFYPKKVYQEYARLKCVSLDAIRRYAIIPVNRDSLQSELDSAGWIQIEISPDYAADDKGQQLSIYGNYPTDSLTSAFIPSPRYVSIERYVDRGDPRLRQPVNFLSDSTDSYYIAAGSSGSTSDLSPLAGRQEGRYNIFLACFKRSGRIMVY